MARTTNEFGGGEIVPSIESITGIQAPVRPDFVAVPFGTVNHEHGERRQIQNLANNLKSSSGIERIPFNGIDELDTEQGPNGEPVHALSTGDSRIRFVGGGWFFGNNGVGSNTEGFFVRGPNLNNYVEITFYGTHLNLLTFMSSPGTTPDWRVSSDGGVTEGSNVFIATSNVINQAGVKSNVVLPVFSSTTADVHTIRIRNAIASSNGLTLFGCEVINENAGITQQPGADFDGRVEALSATTFPIEPDNTTVSSVNGRNLDGTAATYGTHSTGARVLNYLTSGGQYKQSFNLADEAPGFVASTQTYTLAVSTTTSVTLPTTASSFILNAYGAGGGGGGGTWQGLNIGGNVSNFTRGGGGGGGGGQAQATFTRDTSTQAETLAIAFGTAGAVGNGNAGTNFGTGTNGGTGGNTTVTVGSTVIGTGNGGAGGVSVNTGNAGGGGGNGGGFSTAAFTGWDISATGGATGGMGSGGGISFGSNAAFSTNGGNGGNVGGFGNTPLSGSLGQGGPGANNAVGGTGTAPGGAGAGGGAIANADGGSGTGHNGGAGAAGQVFIVVTAAAGLANTDFGVTPGEFTANAVEGGDPGSPTAKFGNAAFDTNRLNQEVIRRINVREFGANNQFATATNAVSQAFTLDDGTTTLFGVRSGTSNAGDLPFASAFGKPYISFNRTGNTDGRKSLIITFVGTGLDTEWIYSGGTSAVYGNIDVTIDGLSIGNLTPIAANAATNTAVVRPIVSGLAYGTHTVSFTSPNNSTGFVNSFGISDFILYGPKKPEIPTLDEGSLELSDYNVMGDYVARTSTSTLFLSKGTLAKAPVRELTYVGSGLLTASDGFNDDPFGSVVGVTGTNDTVSYTFYGTGINVQARTNNVTFVTTVQVDGAALASRFTTTTLSEGAGAYVPGTSTWTGGAGAHNDIILITGMPLGVHTITFTRTAGQFLVEGAWIETPIHINDNTLKIGSEGLNNLTVDPTVEEDEQVVLANLGEAKAWGTFDSALNSLTSAHNIAAIVAPNPNDFIFYFDKPFKDADYTATASTVRSSGGSGANIICAVHSKTPSYVRVNAFNSNGANPGAGGMGVTCYGELIDE